MNTDTAARSNYYAKLIISHNVFCRTVKRTTIVATPKESLERAHRPRCTVLHAQETLSRAPADGRSIEVAAVVQHESQASDTYGLATV